MCNGFDCSIDVDEPLVFQVIHIIDMGCRSRKDHGFMERETHAVFLQKHPAAKPIISLDFEIRVDHIVDISYDHPALPPNFNTCALAPLPLSTSAKLRSMISSPRCNGSSSIANAGITDRKSTRLTSRH